MLLVPEAISSIVLVDFMVGVEMVGFEFVSFVVECNECIDGFELIVVAFLLLALIIPL